MTDNALEHYGVPGMKWGKRKARSTPSSDHSESRNLKTKKVSELTNAELKKINERRQLEKKYNELNPNTLSVGQKQVAAVVALVGTATAVYNLAKNPLVQKGAQAVIKAMTNNDGKHVLVETITKGRHAL